ncbi:XdhC family protein [Halobaculum sp. D14]|uniref:XdhC family protein n=1 Tax=Halobaculum sp. D14 TaxID=3421642 RepID=UPI003EBB2787
MSSPDWSAPETAVFDRISDALDAGDDAVLATVVDVEGSAYRRPGAKMLLDAAGGGAGSITAGCIEDEVRALAADVIDDGAPRVETWDLTGDDDVWGLGVGCNGVITVLLEPLDDSFRPVVAARGAGDPIGVATVVGGDAAPVGARGYFRPGDGFDRGDLPEGAAAELTDALRSLVADGGSETVAVETADGAADVFCDAVRPPPELVVFGSGNDVAPVVELAVLADFRVTVASFRGGDADADRFPGAADVVSVSPRDVADRFDWDDRSYVVVMSHNFVDDRLALDALLDTPAPYVGLMGPEARFDEMREAFDEEGRELTAADRDRIYTPIGLNLGGDTPYQIAHSIVAELLAVANDRTPGHLSQRDGPIHGRDDGE